MRTRDAATKILVDRSVLTGEADYGVPRLCPPHYYSCPSHTHKISDLPASDELLLLGLDFLEMMS
jgi:hypothetical protein